MVGAHETRSWSLTIAISTTSNHAAPTVGPHHRRDDGARTRTAIVCSRRRSPRTVPSRVVELADRESSACRRLSILSAWPYSAVEGLRDQGGVLRRILHRAWSDDTSRITVTIAEGRPDLGRRLEGLEGKESGVRRKSSATEFPQDRGKGRQQDAASAGCWGQRAGPAGSRTNEPGQRAETTSRISGPDQRAGPAGSRTNEPGQRAETTSRISGPDQRAGSAGRISGVWCCGPLCVRAGRSRC
jgi:hypothetical protein